MPQEFSRCCAQGGQAFSPAHHNAARVQQALCQGGAGVFACPIGVSDYWLFWTVTVTGSLACAVASDRTCTTLMPGCMSAGICARIWPAAVCSSGSDVSLNVTHDPPSTVGGGITLAAAGD